MPTGRLAALLILLFTLAVPVARGEVIEEIVALVDGDIVTKSEYDESEQAMIQDIYRRFAGAELDRAVEAVRKTLMMDLIDRKILVHRAARQFDINRMEEVFYESFRDQQGVEDEAQFEAMLAREGMTIASLKKRLVDMFAPDEVVRFEVSSRISVADHEVDTYYAEHPDEFRYEDEVELREIVLMADTEAKRDERRTEAEALHATLKETPFADVAAASSEAGTKSDGGKLGTIKRGDLSESLENAAFALKAGEWSGLLEMPYGFHILYADSAVVGEMRPLEEIRDEVRMRLEDKLYTDRLKEFMVKARAESEWCVRPPYLAKLPAQHADKVCKEM